MSSRPEILFPLFKEMTTLTGVGPKTAQNFLNLNIKSPKDLLFCLPHSFVDRSPVTTVQGCSTGQVVSVKVKIIKHIPPRQRGRPFRVLCEDPETTLELVFFHARGPYLEKILPIGEHKLISGKLEFFDGRAQMAHPDHVVDEDAAENFPRFEPVYPLTSGITQTVMGKAIGSAMTSLPSMPEWLDASVVFQQNWPSFEDALHQAHHPKSLDEVLPHAKPRQRLAYDELFAHQVTKAIARGRMRTKPGRATIGNRHLHKKILNTLPFAPTDAQTRAVSEIIDDLASDRRMNRLLQGDVGAGKTLVAFLALLTAVEAGGQGVLMAPTEILARQHMEGLHNLAQEAGVVMALLTGRDKGAERAEKLSNLAQGKIDILVGTHAVFQTGVEFSDLRLAVIDEQHRFGVNQRLALGEKGDRVDVLVMTATPIPRSLELAQYGDMDVSVLDEKPPGRLPITTAVVPLSRYDEILEKLRSAVAAGTQVYWVCPLVEESEVMDLTAAQERFKKLRAALGDDLVGLVHGQLAPAEKDQAMAKFVAGNTKVLVATTVIEVGVNVPNATIMVIERAESFGLAQLHQLRGRVGRGDKQSTCLLLYQAPLTETAEKRLSIMRETEDGFRIANEDLLIRGAGDVIGTAQSGLPKFRVANLERQAGLMETAQKDARLLLDRDPELQSPRGQAVRTLLWLMEQDRAIRLISVG